MLTFLTYYKLLDRQIQTLVIHWQLLTLTKIYSAVEPSTALVLLGKFCFSGYGGGR